MLISQTGGQGPNDRGANLSNELLQFMTFSSNPGAGRPESVAMAGMDIEDLLLVYSVTPAHVFDFLNFAWKDLSRADKAYPPETFRFILALGRKALDQFITQNINFFELHYDDIRDIQIDVRELTNVLELLPGGAYAAESRLSAREVEIHTYDFNEEAEDYFDDKVLVRCANAFTAYQNKHQAAQTDPNDPVLRLRNCVARAQRDAQSERINIHDFNWARHMKLILADSTHINGYRFHDKQILRRLENELATAETLFLKLKDEHKRNSEYADEDEDDRRQLQQGRVELSAKWAACGQILQTLSAERNGPGHKEPYRNDDLSSTWYYDHAGR